MLCNEKQDEIFQPKIYTVSELANSIKLFVEANFENITLQAEVQDCKEHSSGHVYLVLKDSSNLIDAICWKWTYMKAGIKLENGLEIICTGKVTTYPLRSKYQIVINSYRISGQGALLKLIEDRKIKLNAEGIFLNNRKLPFLPSRIGVITSETGAVIRDIMHRISDRYNSIDVLLWSVLVQGEGAVEQIIYAIDGFNKIERKPDVIIIARGGGSLEDLMPFNDENLARAIFKSKIPIVTAIGHETDTTIADFAADLRAPTPTAAAEMIVPVKTDLQFSVNDMSFRLNNVFLNLIKTKRLNLENVFKSLPSLKSYLEIQVQKLDYLDEKLLSAFKTYLEKFQNKLKLISQLLDSYSYQNTLKRGFVIASDGNKVIKSVDDIEKYLTLMFYNGIINVSVLDKKE